MDDHHEQERNTPMMTITLCIRTVARHTFQYMALAGTTLLLGQTALAEDNVSVLMK